MPLNRSELRLGIALGRELIGWNTLSARLGDRLLQEKSGLSDRRTFVRARDGLIAYGVLAFEPGKRGRPTRDDPTANRGLYTLLLDKSAAARGLDDEKSALGGEEKGAPERAGIGKRAGVEQRSIKGTLEKKLDQRDEQQNSVQVVPELHIDNAAALPPLVQSHDERVAEVDALLIRNAREPLSQRELDKHRTYIVDLPSAQEVVDWLMKTRATNTTGFAALPIAQALEAARSAHAGVGEPDNTDNPMGS